MMSKVIKLKLNCSKIHVLFGQNMIWRVCSWFYFDSAHPMTIKTFYYLSQYTTAVNPQSIKKLEKKNCFFNLKNDIKWPMKIRFLIFFVKKVNFLSKIRIFFVSNDLFTTEKALFLLKIIWNWKTHKIIQNFGRKWPFFHSKDTNFM